MTTENIFIPTLQDGERYLECILQRGDHDLISTDAPRQIAPNLYIVSTICIDCGYECDKYQYVGDSYDI